MSEYTPCSCRDCIDVSTTAAKGGWTLCRECLDAACTPYPPGTGPWPGRRPAGEYECQRSDAQGSDNTGTWANGEPVRGETFTN
ncbi:hypothetical protein AS594_07035 [Streptomyces agglomeratus]|uniref:Uncharacterized protein n=1 Tax=Streptomyces agglomeratus TaxID=285458 RepID=A0A1E5P408_9ACTN|nr:hypothetical protein [Streptomyces agglomeratus]OEJ24276.1 hypothetical protein AS594_07035 [Streptomyces agglomeratus]